MQVSTFEIKGLAPMMPAMGAASGPGQRSVGAGPRFGAYRAGWIERSRILRGGLSIGSGLPSTEPEGPREEFLLKEVGLDCAH